jgi:hypothetical protein
MDILGLLIQLASALQLEGLVTKKPRVTKYTMKPQAVSLNYLSIKTLDIFPFFYSQHRLRRPYPFTV